MRPLEKPAARRRLGGTSLPSCPQFCSEGCPLPRAIARRKTGVLPDALWRGPGHRGKLDGERRESAGRASAGTSMAASTGAVLSCLSVSEFEGTSVLIS
jgi:hypothetical protein